MKKTLIFRQPSGKLIQAGTSRDPIAYTSGVIATLGALGYSVIDDMDAESGTIHWEAWKDGELHLIYEEMKR